MSYWWGGVFESAQFLFRGEKGMVWLGVWVCISYIGVSVFRPAACQYLPNTLTCQSYSSYDMLWSWSVLLSNLGSLSLLHMFISVLVCQRLIINRNVIAKYWETYLERLPTVNLFLAPFFFTDCFLTIGLFHGQLLTICYFLFERFLWKPRKLEPTMKLFPKWFFHCLLRFRHQCTTSFIHLNPTAKEKKFV